MRKRERVKQRSLLSVYVRLREIKQSRSVASASEKPRENILKSVEVGEQSRVRRINLAGRLEETDVSLDIFYFQLTFY